MDNAKPGEDPSAQQAGDAVATAAYLGPVAASSRQPGAAAVRGRRIEGLFCPFCHAAVPADFVYCTGCGRDV